MSVSKGNAIQNYLNKSDKTFYLLCPKHKYSKGVLDMSEKERGGRPRKTPNPVVAERIKQLRISHGDTQEKIAEYLGCSPETYKRGENPNQKKGRMLDQHYLEKLSDRWNTHIDYLLGKTDIKSKDDYHKELDRQKAIEAGFIHAVEKHEAALFEQFFQRCGFDYEKLTNNGGTSELHRLTHSTDPDISATFDVDELQILMLRIRSLVELECKIQSRHT